MRVFADEFNNERFADFKWRYLMHTKMQGPARNLRGHDGKDIGVELDVGRFCEDGEHASTQSAQQMGSPRQSGVDGVDHAN